MGLYRNNLYICTMKKMILFAAGLLVTASLSAQQPTGATFKSEAANDSIHAVNPIDTLNTEDKFTKIVLFDNHTWSYMDMGRPVINDNLYLEHWDTTAIHSYRGYPLDSIPEEVDLLLADSLHNYCPPIVGKVRSEYKFRRTREHQGIDIPLQYGDTVRAAFDGVVRFRGGGRQTGGYGNLVVLRHANGLETYYGHLSKSIVNIGELVKAGEVVGYGGSTGRSTGPHLHFETRYKGQTFDPQRLIDFETGTLRDSIITLKKHYYNIYSHYGQSDEESLTASQHITHTIKSGDTLGGLAAKYNTTIANICKLNNISRSTILSVGRRLIVR